MGVVIELAEKRDLLQAERVASGLRKQAALMPPCLARAEVEALLMTCEQLMELARAKGTPRFDELRAEFGQ